MKVVGLTDARELELLNIDMVQYVKDLYKLRGDMPVPLKIVASLYAKRIKRLTRGELTLRQYVEKSGLFYITLTHTGATLVMPRE